MIKLSIIIPVYNVEGYLAKCLDSVICPGLGDYELIVVNDGSTDSSPAVAARYAEKYPQLIRLISTPNGGLGAARNVGIEAARGSYLVFLDSDDYYTENAVREMLELISGGADMYLFDFHYVNEEGKELIYYRGGENEGECSLEASPAIINSMPCAVNKLCRRELFTETGIRFPGRVWYEDIRTMPKLYLHAERIVYTPKCWYNYFQRSGSITMSNNTERNLEIIPAVDELLDYYRARGEYEHYKTELEFLAFYNQYLTASTRVALIDPKSPVLLKLRRDFLDKHPDFEANPKYKAMPKKWLFLSWLIKHGRYGAVTAVMKLNKLIKGK